MGGVAGKRPGRSVRGLATDRRGVVRRTWDAGIKALDAGRDAFAGVVPTRESTVVWLDVHLQAIHFARRGRGRCY